MSSTRAMHRHKIINIIMKLWIIFTLQKTSLKNFLLSNGHFIARPFIISEFFSFISTVFNVSVALPSGPLIQLKVQFVFLVWILHLFGLPVNLIKLVISVLLVNLFNLLKITCYTMLNYCNAAIFLLFSYFCCARWKINEHWSIWNYVNLKLQVVTLPWSSSTPPSLHTYSTVIRVWIGLILCTFVYAQNNKSYHVSRTINAHNCFMSNAKITELSCSCAFHWIFFFDELKYRVRLYCLDETNRISNVINFFSQWNVNDDLYPFWF